MRQTMVIASIHHDPSLTVEMIERFTRVDPAKVPVFTTFDDQPKPLGHCVRLWRVGLELWAEMDVLKDWSDPSLHAAEFHAECVIGGEQKSTSKLLAVVLTSMPRGMLAAQFQSAFEQFRASTQN
jgi:hypothetical protein